jgi:hypothetical protein
MPGNFFRCAFEQYVLHVYRGIVCRRCRGGLQCDASSILSRQLKAHLIYDEDEEKRTKNDVQKIIKETSGIYKGLDAAEESKKLRKSWERNAKK